MKQPPRPPGRPRVDDDDDSVHVGITLPERQYDKYAKLANAEGTSVPAIIRRELEKKYKK
jgi:hypothetical protein